MPSMRLLCVDDDRINTLLVQQVCLSVGGIEFECAESGAEAAAVVADWRPDLLVLDLYLPDTDGFALLQRLRTELDAPALPAVLCTAESAGTVQDRAHAAGFEACWTKPVAPADLQAALRRWQAGPPGARADTPA